MKSSGTKKEDGNKPKKKKLMVVKDFPTPDGRTNSSYLPPVVGFAFLEPPGKNGERVQSTNWTACREGLVGILLKAMHNDGNHIVNYANNVVLKTTVDTERMRLLAVVAKPLDDNDVENKRKRLFKAKSILNIYETYAGFDNTKIATVNHETYERAWLFTGGRNKGWMASAAIFTFACLVIRLSLVLEEKFLDTLAESKDIDELTDKWGELIKDSTCIPKGCNYKDDIIVHMKNSHKKISLILKYHDELFKDINPFPAENSSFYSTGGIYSTCKCESFCKEINERLKVLFEDKKL